MSHGGPLIIGGGLQVSSHLQSCAHSSITWGALNIYRCLGSTPEPGFFGLGGARALDFVKACQVMPLWSQESKVRVWACLDLGSSVCEDFVL